MHTGLPRRQEAVIALAVRICRRDQGPVLSSELRVLEDHDSLQGFHQWSMDQGILGLVLNTLKRSAALAALGPIVSRQVLAPLRILHPQAVLWSMERDRVVAMLQQAGIDPVVLKGGALRETVYENHSDRPVGDLDILVPATDLDIALDVLHGGGYTLPTSPEEIERFRTQHFHLPLASLNGFEVELHWGLGQPAFLWQLDPEGFLSRSKVIQSGKTLLRVPDHVDMLLHLCTQNTEDSFSKIRRLVDMDRLAARYPIDWDVFVSRARHGGIEIIAGLSLHLANRLLGAGFPADVITALVPSRMVRFHLAALCPDQSIMGGRQPRPGVGEKALAIWLTSPRNRLMQLRNTIRGTDEMTRVQTGPWEGMGRALRIWAYHMLLWARGLLNGFASTTGKKRWHFWDVAPTAGSDRTLVIPEDS